MNEWYIPENGVNRNIENLANQYGVSYNQALDVLKNAMAKWLLSGGEDKGFSQEIFASALAEATSGQPRGRLYDISVNMPADFLMDYAGNSFYRPACTHKFCVNKASGISEDIQRNIVYKYGIDPFELQKYIVFNFKKAHLLNDEVFLSQTAMAMKKQGIGDILKMQEYQELIKKYEYDYINKQKTSLAETKKTEQWLKDMGSALLKKQEKKNVLNKIGKWFDGVFGK